MTHSVTVAEAGDPNVPPSHRISSIPDLDRPWAGQLKVTLDVEDDELLGDLLRRAGRELDRMGPFGGEPDAWEPVYFVIYREGQRQQLWHELALVDGQGHLRWTYKWGDEPYSELLRAIEAGAITGDPTRLYFTRMGGMGDGIVADFPMLLENLALLWEVVEHTTTAYGAYEGARKLLKMAGIGRKATDVAGEKAQQWEANGGMPYKLSALFLRADGWDSAELGRLLDVTDADAEALLTTFGCAQGSDNRWRPRADELSKLMAGNAEYVLQTPHTDRAAVREVLEQRIDVFLKTSKAPALDWERLSSLPMDPKWSANHQQGYYEPRWRDTAWHSAVAWWWRLRLAVHRLRRR